MDTVKFDWKISLRHPFRIHYSTHLSGVSEGVTDIHSSIHIGLLIKGDTTGSHNGEILTVNEGGIYLTAPWEPHRTLSSEKGNNLLLITAETGILNQLLPGCGEKLDMLCRIAPRRRQEILDQAEIPEFYSRTVIRLLAEPESSSRELKLYHAAMGIVLAVATLEFSAEVDLDYQRLLPALEKLGRKPVSVLEAAVSCNLSESHFAHLFRRVFKMSFARYERLYRLRGAVSELQYQYTGLKEAAAEWGFYDKNHFAKTCIKYFGFSPALYRKKRSADQ